MKESNEELKKKIESILFAAGKKIELAEIAKLCRLSHNLRLVEQMLDELKKKYEGEESPLLLIQEGTAWKLTVRERYVPLVQDIVKQSELSKTIIETLAVVAYKSPVLQSEIIKIRTNKAYDHLKELEQAGYITREKKGRTKLIKLSPKFFEYFDVPPEKIKERFRTVKELEKAVELKEAEAAEVKEEMSKKKGVRKKEEEKIKKSTEEEIEKLDRMLAEKEEKLPEIDLIDRKGHKKKLKIYASEIAEGTELEKPKTNIAVVEEKVGQLDIVEMGLPAEEKALLVQEAELMKKEDVAEEARRLGKAEEEIASKEREKEFEKKFALFGEKEEVPAPKPAEEEKEEGIEEMPPAEEAEEAAEEMPPERITATGIAAEAAEEMKKHPPQERKGKMLFEKGVPKEMQERIDKRVEEIVFGKKEKEEEEKEEKGKTPESY